MKYLPLSHGHFALVDDDDYSRLSQWKWHIRNLAPYGYAARTVHHAGRSVPRLLHYEVLGLRHAPRPFVVDHINGLRLDNRKCNLRYATYAQNAINKPPCKRPGATSQYKGVSYDRRRRAWLAAFTFNHRIYPLGRFDTEYDAMVAYNRKACQIAGPFAYINHWTGPTHASTEVSP